MWLTTGSPLPKGAPPEARSVLVPWIPCRLHGVILLRGAAMLITYPL